MKKISLFILTTLLFAGVEVMAQERVDSAAKKVGNKAASTAVKGVSTIKDKVYKGKIAPDGSSVYIDNKDRKYYIDKKGKKIFLKASQIRDKAVDE
jgi:hypothetical protein